MANGNVSKLAITLTVGSALAVATAIVAVTLYVGRIDRCNAEQQKDIDYGAVVATDHEKRIRGIEDAMREIREQKPLLERILDAVENNQ